MVSRLDVAPAPVAELLQAANANRDFVQQELLWNLVGLYPTLTS